MDKEVLEKIENLVSELSKMNKQILTELDVYIHKYDNNIKILLAENKTLKYYIEKYFDYQNYFNKQNDPNKLKE